MNWNMLDLAVRRLNPSSLRDWKNLFSGMDVWMQAVVIGVLVLLVGVSALSAWWGLKMQRAARFGCGAAAVFGIALILLTTEYSLPMNRTFLYAALAGAAGGVLYAFAERLFQFAAGFVLGTVLSAYLLPRFFHLKVTAGNGRIWTLMIAAAMGVLFAIFSKKLRFVLTALEGGVVLGLLCDACLPVGKIPWVKERLTAAQVRNLLPVVIAASGVLVQLIQLLAIRAEQKALEIPTGEEREDTSAASAEPSSRNPSGEAAAPAVEEISMVQAEELLVEKAKELALAATRSAEQARLKERYEDVMAGLYTTKVASERLGISEEAFVDGMKRSGYTIPGQDPISVQPADSSGAEEAASAAPTAGDKAQENSAAAGGQQAEPQENTAAAGGQQAESQESTAAGSGQQAEAQEG